MLCGQIFGSWFRHRLSVDVLWCEEGCLGWKWECSWLVVRRSQLVGWRLSCRSEGGYRVESRMSQQVFALLLSYVWKIQVG